MKNKHNTASSRVGQLYRFAEPDGWGVFMYPPVHRLDDGRWNYNHEDLMLRLAYADIVMVVEDNAVMNFDQSADEKGVVLLYREKLIFVFREAFHRSFAKMKPWG